MEGIFSAQWLAALGSILLLDLILSGDNAILIALACKNLPEGKKIKAMVDVWISNGILVVEHRPDAKREMKSFVVSGEPIDVCRT